MRLALRFLKWGLIGLGLLSVFIVGSFMVLVIVMNSDGTETDD